tara:strand:- start:138 stop:1904 length:1767 start_codon:yes stop_codon:yes gene_type:complete
LSKKKDTKWFIAKAKSIHGGFFDYKNSIYINAKEKIEIKCQVHNKTFFQTSNNHFSSKFPCEECNKEHKKKVFSDGNAVFIKKMKSKFGSVFDYTNTTYVNQSTKLKIRCKNCNYEIFSSPQVLLNGKGCPECYKQKVKKDFVHNKLLEINDYVKNIGGKCLSNDYSTNHENLKFQCKKGHVFYESWADVKYSMRWCKECAPNRLIGETLTRMILEHLLSTKMPSSYLKSMGGLQLDGYSKKRNIAFEYQGYQHYTKNSFFHTKSTDFGSQKNRDSQKKILCKKNGIILIEIFEFKSIRKSKIPVFVKEVKGVLDQLGLKYITKPFIPDLERLYRGRESKLYQNAKEVVESRNATIQSYIGSESKHIVTCKHGHGTKKNLGVLTRDGFNCPDCIMLEKYFILKAKIEKRGGKLINEKLKNKGYSNLYEWVCDKGHKNLTKGHYLFNGHWCKKCQTINQTVQVNKEEFIAVAKDNTITTNEKLTKLNISSSVFYSRLRKFKIKNSPKPQDRRSQDISSKSKGEIYQLDPDSFKVIKKYKYLEAVRKESNGRFKPEGIRGQMKKNKKAYGFYWVRENEYKMFLNSLNKDM